MSDTVYFRYTDPSPMKRLSSILILFLTLITCARAQIITITFEGTLNATPIPLDSILVMNLTAGGDTTIYFPDNMLVLDGATGLEQMDLQAPVLRNQPNPFDGGTDILVSTRNSGQAMLTVHDATGREVAAFSRSLAAGQHRFRYNSSTPGVHLLTVLQGGERATHRLVALGGVATGAALTYAGGNAAGGTAKSDRSLFTWTPGDELRYIGYATDAGIVHSAAIDEVPVATATRIFELFAGLACPESPTVTDIDGNVYPAVQIGGQCWMAENLRTTTYNDGNPIPQVTEDDAWIFLNSGAWSNYENNAGYDASYGKLYNWYAAANPNMCPQGWHVPSDAEWQQLELALGMPASEVNIVGYRGAAQNVGGKMKTTTLWEAPNTGATNESGFSGLPGGGRYSVGFGFINLGFYGTLGSTSESGAEGALGRDLVYDDAGVGRGDYNKTDGTCLRCVRD